jgi:hypothetical protein
MKTTPISRTESLECDSIAHEIAAAEAKLALVENGMLDVENEWSRGDRARVARNIAQRIKQLARRRHAIQQSRFL